jgi:hypothetical protein
MDGERTIAAKTRPRKRPAAEMAPAAEMPPTATEMPTAEMPPAMAATVKMPPASVATTMATSTVASAAMTTAATFRDGIARGRQSGRKNKDGNSNSEF